MAILLIWVDDFISISSNNDLNDRIKKELKSHFEVKSLGQPSLIISIKIQQGNHIIKLFQTHYIDKLLSKYRLQDVNPLSTPMDTTIKLDDQNEAPEEKKTLFLSKFGYANLIGSLMYLAIVTRPDIAYSVNKLAQYSSAPKPKHWTAIKCVFRYLKGTKYSELVYGRSPELINDRINFYCDADWASDLDRKLISGYVVTIAGVAVAWSSKKQSTIAPSTPEAE